MHLKLVSIGIYALTLVVVGNKGGGRAFGQECPHANSTGPDITSQVQTLEGRLIFHDDIRQWFELRLKRPQCGQRSIQLIQKLENSQTLDIFRGCRVKSIGTIGISPTGYYSLDTFQEVEKIELVGACPAQPSLFDHSEAKPDQAIHAYRVDMHVIYRSGDHPIVFHVWSAGKERRPWQAYASYWLTGDFVLYGHCGNGFVVDTVFGTPEAHPEHFDEPRTPSDSASFDPESAAQAGKRDLHLGYTCIRATQTDRSSIQ